MGNAHGSIQRYQSTGDSGALVEALKQLDASPAASPPVGSVPVAAQTFSAAGLGPAVNDQASSYVPPGYSFQTLPVFAGSGSVIAMQNGTLSSIRAQHITDPGNPPGSTVSYAFAINDVVVPAYVQLAASGGPTLVNGLAMVAPVPYAAGDRINVLAYVQTGGPPALAASPSNIAVSIG